MDLFYLLGIVGAALILIGFLIRKNPKHGIGTLTFQLLNLLGAIFLTVYAWAGQVWPFVVLNVVWTGDSLVAVIKNLRKK